MIWRDRKLNLVSMASSPQHPCCSSTFPHPLLSYPCIYPFPYPFHADIFLSLSYLHLMPTTLPYPCISPIPTYIYILPYPSYPLYPYILPLIPLFDTHSFTKSLFSHPTYCLSPFFSSPFVTHESTSFVSLHVIILTRIRPSYSASFVHF